MQIPKLVLRPRKSVSFREALLTFNGTIVARCTAFRVKLQLSLAITMARIAFEQHTKLTM